MMGSFGVTGGFGWGVLFMILWWVLVIMGIVALVKWLSGPSGSDSRRDGRSKALDILRERYARGEIDEQEFHKRKHDLMQ